MVAEPPGLDEPGSGMNAGRQPTERRSQHGTWPLTCDLRQVLTAYLRHYNTARPHRLKRHRPPEIDSPTTGPAETRPRRTHARVPDRRLTSSGCYEKRRSPPQSCIRAQQGLREVHARYMRGIWQVDSGDQLVDRRAGLARQATRSDRGIGSAVPVWVWAGCLWRGVKNGRADRIFRCDSIGRPSCRGSAAVGCCRPAARCRPRRRAGIAAAGELDVVGSAGRHGT